MYTHDQRHHRCVYHIVLDIHPYPIPHVPFIVMLFKDAVLADFDPLVKPSKKSGNFIITALPFGGVMIFNFLILCELA